MNADELKARTKQFALRVLKLGRAMPKSVEGKVVTYQIVKSGTSVGANYRACCRARSRAEFIAKMSICLEEADETAYWLEVIIESGMLKSQQVTPLLHEANELTAIFNSSRFSAKRYR